MVLVVDDDPDILFSLATLLEMEGYTVRTAAHGRGALEVLADTRPCVILLDLMMPVMDGYAFLDHRAGDAVLKEIPVVVLTGMDRLPRVEDGTRILRKPIDPNELMGAVQQHCQARG